MTEPDPEGIIVKRIDDHATALMAPDSNAVLQNLLAMYEVVERRAIQIREANSTRRHPANNEILAHLFSRIRRNVTNARIYLTDWADFRSRRAATRCVL
jgi:hypothetical protein